MRTVIVEALLLLAFLSIVAIAFRRRWFDRLAGLSPTQPSDPDETDDREESGADPEYGDTLAAISKALREEDARDEAARAHQEALQPIADEYGLNLDNPADKKWAEEVLAFRRSGGELAQHYRDDRLGHLEQWLDGWAPEWRRLRLGNVQDDTSEFEAVTV